MSNFALTSLALSSVCPTNKVIVDDKPTMAKRLVLCSRTLGILEAGLRLLGIEPLEKM